MTAHAKKVCAVCGEQIDGGWIERHEADCKKRTPEERSELVRARRYGRVGYAKKLADRRTASGTKKWVERPRVSMFASNGRPSTAGKRAAVTLSVDLDQLYELLLKLNIAIEKVEIR